MVLYHNTYMALKESTLDSEGHSEGHNPSFIRNRIMTLAIGKPVWND